MEIQVGAYTLVGDEHQWTVKHTSSTNGHRLAKSETTTKVVAFHNRLTNALEWVCDHRLRTERDRVQAEELIAMFGDWTGAVKMKVQQESPDAE